MSSELEVLDQLLGGDMRVSILLGCFASPMHAQKGIRGLLENGDVRLLSETGEELPRPEWRSLVWLPIEDWVAAMASLTLAVTDEGAKRVA
jgi:hypothetical protein